MSESLLSAAQKYAKNEWPVLPLHSINAGECSCGNATCSSPGKHPRTLHGLKEASTDNEQIETWWRRWPQANIGLATGIAFDVLDIDGPQGATKLTELMEIHGQLPKAPWVRTGKGAHIYFKPTGIRNKVRLEAELDWRGQGGYVVAPPSTHVSGSQYFWDVEGELPEAPEWLIELVNPITPPIDLSEKRRERDSAYLNKAVEAELTRITTAPPGTRNDTVNRAAFSLYQLVWGGELSYPDTTQALTQAAQSLNKADNPFPDREIETVLRSAYEGARNTPRTVPQSAIELAKGKHPSSLVEIIQEPEPTELMTYSDLMSMDLSFNWLSKDLIIDPTFGMLAGEEKTLKSHVTTLIALSIASGEPLFDRFKVERQGPVLIYVGEGGMVPYARRLRRLAHAMGVTTDLPLFQTFKSGTLLTEDFVSRWQQNLEDIKPALVILDPYYAYHGSLKEAAHLHQEGEALVSLSGPCIAQDASLIIVNHYSKTSTGNGLKRITMAGGKEWSDSWWLMSHREPPQVSEGRFQMRLDVGSRQWGGAEWDLDLSLGHFNTDLNDFDGDISWNLSRSLEVSQSTQDSIERNERQEALIAIVTAAPGQFSREELLPMVAGNMTPKREMLRRLIDEGLIRDAPDPNFSGPGRPKWRLWPPDEPEIDRQIEF